VRRLEALQSDVQDIARTLDRLGQRFEADPERLSAVEQRIEHLRRLEAKYRKPIDELIAYRDGLDEQETKLEREEEDLGSIETEMSVIFARLRQAAMELSKGRAKVAKRLASEAQKELAELGMGEARLTVALHAMPLGDDVLAAEVPARGADQAELMLAANPGEAALPLRKVASGGELSRTMLALKTVLAGHDRPGTLVFDEIDANVGGRLGDVLGQKLAALGRRHQVICVTHLPQVASYACSHWTIKKVRRGGRTLTQVTLLEGSDRIEELASMLRGEARGETTRKEAAAMLQAAQQKLDGAT
jgi:DNA repair protein RecN (Recombination protein N)